MHDLGIYRNYESIVGWRKWRSVLGEKRRATQGGVPGWMVVARVRRAVGIAVPGWNLWMVVPDDSLKK